MKKLKKFLKEETQGWEKWEIFWLVFANLVILGVSLYLGDTAIGIIASLTGTSCVILCGKEMRIIEHSNKILFEDTDCLITRFFYGVPQR